MIKQTLTYLWTIYSLIVFLILGSVFFLVEMLLISLGEFAHKAAHRMPAFSARLLLFFWGIRVKEHNKSLLKNLPPCVIVINHRSDLDAIIATAYMPGIYKFIGKQELISYPFIGKLVEKLYITVDRRSKTSRQNSIRKMRNEGATGVNIVVFPEGWSNFSDSYLLPLNRGAFNVAVATKAPVLICTLIGTHELFPKPKVSLRPGKVDLFWEKIIPIPELANREAEKLLRKETMEIFLKRLRSAYPNGYSYSNDQKDFESWRQEQLKK